jgi:hypothetical protein
LTTDLARAHVPVPAARPDDLVELTAADWSALPADRHPVLVYLAGLALSGRRSQRSGLERLAAELSSGRLDALQLPWHLLRYRHVKALRSWLVEQATTQAGNVFVMVDVTFTNKLDQEQHANPTQFVLMDGAGVKHSWRPLLDACPTWDPVNLTRGATFGPKCLSFEAAANKPTGLALVWTPSLLGGGYTMKLS